MVRVVYGFPEVFVAPPDLDFYVLSNEDIGFTASLINGTNDVYSFALPYPSSMDLYEETIIVYCIEFIYQFSGRLLAGLAASGLEAYLSMLDKEFTATFVGTGADAEDENLKAHFASGIFFGRKNLNVTATASVEGTERQADSNVNAMYFPPIPLDLLTPLYIQFVNASTTITLATNAIGIDDFAGFEKVYLRVWFTKRPLTKEEKSARQMQIRWQRMDS